MSAENSSDIKLCQNTSIENIWEYFMSAENMSQTRLTDNNPGYPCFEYFGPALLAIYFRFNNISPDQMIIYLKG